MSLREFLLPLPCIGGMVEKAAQISLNPYVEITDVTKKMQDGFLSLEQCLPGEYRVQNINNTRRRKYSKSVLFKRSYTKSRNGILKTC